MNFDWIYACCFSKILREANAPPQLNLLIYETTGTFEFSDSLLFIAHCLHNVFLDSGQLRPNYSGLLQLCVFTINVSFCFFEFKF